LVRTPIITPITAPTTTAPASRLIAESGNEVLIGRQ
jgi:hypothetical protein